ncbi:STAS/SEC14 domain-containing protein [Ferrimonas lipolytica]|uniref:STAS/SEC14 domain-containing protein n=1 Tax=Ferrimonas lipolytica TaxID=2724191 RepID=A0A6H1UD06_9GAMM|nr:STAS/SEC14 domain-containing protein [Ferrimonas lipolytica]QIZ76965.1 STAS/SEC14 domain-containing protein [Ferrimonas lipolytica]
MDITTTAEVCMLQVKLDHCAGIVIIDSDRHIEQAQLRQALLQIRPYLYRHQHLQGVLWSCHHLPHWRQWQDIKATLEFIAQLNHHTNNFAVVTNSAFGDLVAKLSLLWKQPTVRHFALVEQQQAQRWLMTTSS